MLELWLSFSIGLAGSGHCLGMCGGIVTALALSRRDSGPVQRFFFNLLYHLGRVATYLILGLLASFAVRAGMFETLRPYQDRLYLAANLFVIAIGLFTLFDIRSLGISALDGAGWGVSRKLMPSFNADSSLLAALPAGLAMGLIPCGLVYGVLISAAISGSVIKGGGMMLAFGIGTLPALLAFGQVTSSLSVLGRGVFQRFMGAFVALLGIAGVWKLLFK